jgi:HAD superfamily hydrolase (TIGR01549 family)
VAYETILFDMDGVLLTGYHTDRAVYRQAAAATLADFGVEISGDPPAALVDPDTVAEVRATCDELGLPAAPAWAYRERAATTIENEGIVDGERTSFPDTDVLSTLAEAATIGVVSNNRHGTVRFVADYFEWPVDAVRGRYPTLEEFAHLKPHPRLLLGELDRLGVEDALFVGDRRTDVEAAHRASIDAALLSRGGDPAPGEAEPKYHIESLSELPALVAD